MAEIHNDNPEIKSSSPEKSCPEPAKAVEGDKEKLSPLENDAAKPNKENNEKNDTTDMPKHPKLEANNNEINNDQLEGNKHPVESNEHKKLTPAQSNEQNLEQPKGNEFSPYAKEKLDNFPKDAPAEIKPAYERACAAEPKITKDMQDATDALPNAQLEGLDYRLKDGDSFARKANTVSENKGIPIEDAANNMHDINRYTQVSDGDHLVDNANSTLAGLKDKGYTIDDVNSTWGEDGAYKGINCKLTSPEGQPCELQFHTPESLATKEPMHKLYEEQRQFPEGSKEWNAYEDQMRDMSSSLTPPKNIENLKTNYD